MIWGVPTIFGNTHVQSSYWLLLDGGAPQDSTRSESLSISRFDQSSEGYEVSILPQGKWFVWVVPTRYIDIDINIYIYNRNMSP